MLPHGVKQQSNSVVRRKPLRLIRPLARIGSDLPGTSKLLHSNIEWQCLLIPSLASLHGRGQCKSLGKGPTIGSATKYQATQLATFGGHKSCRERISATTHVRQLIAAAGR